MPDLWPAHADGPPIMVKVLSYNLFWWSLYGVREGDGESASKLVEKAGKPVPWDFMGFQECQDIKRVLEKANLLEEFAIAPGNYQLAMAWRKKAWDLIAQGEDSISEDNKEQYFGRRDAQWARLRNIESNKVVFFVNHHGPLPVDTGGLCGSDATAHKLLDLIKQHAQEGDGVILVGDFNSGTASKTIKDLQGKMLHVFHGTVDGGIDNVFTNQGGCSVVNTANLGSGGSDHDAIAAIVAVGAGAGAMIRPDLLPTVNPDPIEHAGEGGAPVSPDPNMEPPRPAEETEQGPPFNCAVDDDDMENKWPQIKKDWCCSEHHKGCKDEEGEVAGDTAAEEGCVCDWASDEGACDEDDGTPCHGVCCKGHVHSRTGQPVDVGEPEPDDPPMAPDAAEPPVAEAPPEAEAPPAEDVAPPEALQDLAAMVESGVPVG